MKEYIVKPLDTNVKDTICVSVPGSKSITNRALLMAALADGETVLNGALFSDDSRYFISSLISLGYTVDVDETNKRVKVVGENGKIPLKEGKIYVGSAGTAARFLTCMCGLSDGVYTIDASAQMKKRPMEPLMRLLEGMGAKIEYLEEKYHLPVVITGCAGNKCDVVDLDISKSTQFLSALLMTSVMRKDGLNIHITSEKKYGSYIEITLKMMKQFGVTATFDGCDYHIESDSSYKISEYDIEPDVSAAGYFFAMSAITGRKVIVKGIRENSMQGDIKLLDVLKEMGCDVNFTDAGVGLERKSMEIKHIEVDMNNFSDQTMTLAAVAIYADGPTKITGIGHIRLQESDRLMAIVNEFEKIGIKTEHGEDYIVIYPGTPKPARMLTYDDHRMAMSFALIGLRNEGIVIDDPMCCRKTFENYFEILSEIK